MSRNPIFMIWIWVIIGLFLSSLISETWTHSVRHMDEVLSVRYLGKARDTEIREEADRVYQSLLPPGPEVSISSLFMPDRGSRLNLSGLDRNGADVGAFLSQRLALLGDAIYRIIWRGLLVLAFLPFLLAALLPFLVDGMMQRKIRQSNFDYPSPLAHRSSLYTLTGVLALFPILLVAPVPMPPQTIPLLMIVIPWAANIHIANTQKRI